MPAPHDASPLVQLDQKRQGVLLIATSVMLGGLAVLLGVMGMSWIVTTLMGLFAVIPFVVGMVMVKLERLVVTEQAVMQLRGADVVHELALARLDHLHYCIAHEGSGGTRSTTHRFNFVDREARETFEYAQQVISEAHVEQLLTHLASRGIEVRRSHTNQQ